jgi:hypothetical protein
MRLLLIIRRLKKQSRWDRYQAAWLVGSLLNSSQRLGDFKYEEILKEKKCRES